MTGSPQSFQLDAIRTDGWFERVGEGIGSFKALCNIVGARFFAFSIIVGARITALTVDRRNPDQTQVDFVVGLQDDGSPLESQRLALGEFRRRLVGVLLVEEETFAEIPTDPDDIEAIQLFIGIRYLLLAPLYGYSLRTLTISPNVVTLLMDREGFQESHELGEFRMGLRALVREELDRTAPGARNVLDLSKVPEAEAASERRDWGKVVALLGSWPAPLAIFLRTPEGQTMNAETRATVAKGLGLLGTACVYLEEVAQAEEVFRVGIQYAQDGLAAADLFRRLGDALLGHDRPGESIGPFRRALAYGGEPTEILPRLARALIRRHRFVAAYACIVEAMNRGLAKEAVIDDLEQIQTVLGASLATWKTFVTPSV